MTVPPFSLESLPRIEFAAEPGLAELYEFAWKLAYDHIRECPGAPQTPYMDEGFSPDRIWIWDTCFMVNFCKYAPQLFPGAVSLDNFYRPLLDGVKSPLQIQHPDNPPLLAWAEAANYQVTGDRNRIRRILIEKRYLQRYFEWVERLKSGQTVPGGIVSIGLERTPFGYRWSGTPSGMDNTPRGGVAADEHNLAQYRQIYWVDALAQQALSAEIIARLAEDCGLHVDAEFFQSRYQELKMLLNTYYYDAEDGFYYDIATEPPFRPCKVKTPASYWAMLAGVCSPEQAAAMVRQATDPQCFGGDYPWPSVSRSDPAFNPAGEYWRGGVWLPMAYLGTKALERYGYYAEADQLAYRVVMQQFRTWRDFEPHTIWEAYSPTADRPSTDKAIIDAAKPVRPDFCGWSALGPICLMIENVLGIAADGIANRLHWRVNRSCRNGISNLQFGGNRVDLQYDGDGALFIRAEKPFTLQVDGEEYAIAAGKTRLHN
ncbi:trehalase family glycosidase [Victivallis sp. Marseille-Q1083]|uniref:MGH1-like glycoside hydrolase domain-containing protein n=1 Tax=Victivallis sp. Marseille-Q1083 TaxID=2717288 RepID=UPI00158AF8F7|nr:trehalase family glycosidase [Victivallis sp. Marseille-Q1083]